MCVPSISNQYCVEITVRFKDVSSFTVTLQIGAGARNFMFGGASMSMLDLCLTCEEALIIGPLQGECPYGVDNPDTQCDDSIVDNCNTDTCICSK